MTERDWRGEFVEVEQRAHDLVEVLEELKREASEYRDLNRTIEGGSQAIEEVAGGLSDLLPKVEQVVETMNELGVPSLRHDVDAISKRLDQLGTRLEASLLTLRRLVWATSIIAAVGAILVAFLLITGSTGP